MIIQDYRHIQRREFLVLAASSLGGALTAHAAKKGGDPRYVSLGDAHKGTLAIDLRIMNQFTMQHQAVQDFYTAARKAMAEQDPDSAVAAICRKFKRGKLGGPMLGDVTSTSVAVWMHLPEPGVVTIEMSPETGGETKSFSSKRAERIISVCCEGLSPDTAYTYKVVSSDKKRLGTGRFVTPPAELSEKPLRISFGTCFHKIGIYRPELMQLVRERGSRAMLVLGDSAVDDRKCDYGLINADYLLRNLSTPWQELTANVPVYASWDDHDYWGNDTAGTYSQSKKKIDVDGLRQSWNSQWNNPKRDKERKGIYFQTKIGPVHFIALDTRSCRVNDQRGKLNSFIGEEQMGWLKKQITESTSPFILLSSGTMWTDYISAGKDSWGAWDTEGREEIFKLIDGKKDSKVILLSGDRHGARGFAIPRPGGKKIYELEPATLGGVPGPGAFGKDKSAQLFGIPSRSWAFGELSFSAVGGVPQATLRLINERGEELETVTLE